MTYYLAILIAGFGGGAIRGILGFTKHQFAYKNVGFDIKYFFGMIFISGVVGVLVAMATKELGGTLLGEALTPAMALIVGYAGGDFLENVYKLRLKKGSSNG